jgi:protein tyrosine/serine phosphatase
VFRADGINRLTETDLEVALALGLRTVIDLRSTFEVTEEGRFDGADDLAFFHLPVFEHGELPFKPVERDDPEPPHGEFYAVIATTGREAIASALRVIAQGEHAVVFHCAAGKDRTGIIAALILSVLGVPDDAIVADYHLSERALEPTIAWAEVNDPDMATWMANAPPWMLRCPAPTMQAFLDILRAQHGSIEGFLTDAGLEADVTEVLRARLLEP